MGHRQLVVVQLLKKWMYENDTNKTGLAKHCGLPHARISEIFNGKRVLSPYFNTIFVQRRVYMIEEVYKDDPVSNEEKEYWEALKIGQDHELMLLLHKAFTGSLRRADLVNILKSHATQPD